MQDLEVRELRYFAAVAEELNFSRAAERLGIAQPPLSRAIRQLETRLGVQLFDRSKRQVKLTVAGETLRDEAEHALAAVSAAARRTRRAGLVVVPSLAVTAKPGVAAGLLQRIVDSYLTRHDTPRVEIVVSGYRQQAGMVRDGRADLALLSSPYDEPGLVAEPLFSEPRIAALPTDHKLARRRTLRCRDLQGLPFPIWPESSQAERLYWSGRDGEVSSAPIELGSDVHGPAVSDGMQLLEVVGLGQAVALIPLSLAEQNPRADVVYRPVLDASPYTIVIAWRAEAREPSIPAFVRIAIEVATHEHGPTSTGIPAERRQRVGLVAV